MDLTARSLWPHTTIHGQLQEASALYSEKTGFADRWLESNFPDLTTSFVATCEDTIKDNYVSDCIALFYQSGFYQEDDWDKDEEGYMAYVGRGSFTRLIDNINNKAKRRF